MDEIIKDCLRQGVEVGILTESLSKLYKNISKIDIMLAIARVSDAMTKIHIEDDDWEQLDDDQKYPTKLDGFYFHEDTKQGVRWKPDPYGLAKYFVRELNLKYDESGTYLYNGKFYDLVSEDYMLHKIMKLTMQRSPSNFHLNEFLRIMKPVAYCENLNVAEGYLNLDNGILDLSKLEIIPHTPKIFLQHCLPHSYDREATCPRFDQFLDEIFMGDQERVDLAYEIMAYTLQGGRPYLEKAFILDGVGQNGKSTYINIFKKVMGEHNFTTIPMNKIEDEKAICMLDGRLANLVEETPTEKINAEAFKNLVSGGDVYARDVYSQGYRFKNRSRLIFACNSKPFFGDNSFGNRRRLCFLPFDTIIEKPDLQLEEKLQPELSGILNKIIDKIKTLNQKKALTMPKICDRYLEEYKLDTDYVYRFVSETCVIGDHTYHPVTGQAVFDTFKQWMVENNANMNMTRNGFYKKLESIQGLKVESRVMNKQKHYVNLLLNVSHNKMHNDHLLIAKKNAHWVNN
jgi:P4 family phage/plasmid primase-like protien